MSLKYRLLAVLCLIAILGAFLNACGPDDSESQTPTPKNLNWSIGGRLPTPEDFFDSIPDGCKVRFENEDVMSSLSLGKCEVTLIYTDTEGNETPIQASFTLGIDQKPPVISGTKDISVCLGDGISYRSGVSVTDDFDGEVRLEIDSSAVNPSAVGHYPVVYTAYDNAGNQTTLTVYVWIYKETVTEDMLWQRVDVILAENGIRNLATKEKQARAVFEYVYYGIRYDAYSDKSDWVRAAYEGLKNGYGDCYTYFAVSKAFFVRLGIDNMDVKRTEGIVAERHYWNLVNIGTAQSPAWYHFDACQLSGVSFKGCLLTDGQLAQYTATRANEAGQRDYFYAFNASALPPRAGTAITDPYAYLA